MRELARAIGKIAFPVGGELLSAGAAAAGTWGIGEAAIAYFIHRKRADRGGEGAVPASSGEETQFDASEAIYVQKNVC